MNNKWIKVNRPIELAIHEAFMRHLGSYLRDFFFDSIYERCNFAPVVKVVSHE